MSDIEIFKILRDHELNRLKVMVVLLRSQSVSKTAELLDINQPTISKYLEKLRKEFSDPLLIRDGNRMRLTPTAQELLPKIESALKQIANIFSETGSFNPSNATGHFRIGANDYGQILIGAPLLKALRKQSPNIIIEFRPIGPTSPEKLLTDGIIDLVIGSHSPTTRLRSQLLYEDPLICVTTANKAEIPDQLDISDFSKMDHLDISPSGTGLLASLIEATINEQGGHRNIKLTTSSFMSTPHMLNESNLIALVPRKTLSVISSPGLRTIKLNFTLPNYRPTLWWHNISHVDPLSRWIREQIISTCRASLIF